jgi:hypothetical protein
MTPPRVVPAGPQQEGLSCGAEGGGQQFAAGPQQAGFAAGAELLSIFLMLLIFMGYFRQVRFL